MGSRRRLNAVLGGDDPLDVWNQRSDPAYKVRALWDVVKAGGLGINGDMKNAKVAKDVMPNVDKPISPVGKIRGYVLNFESEEGRHKARVLSAAFGLTDSDADIGYLANALTTALPSGTITRELYQLNGVRNSMSSLPSPAGMVMLKLWQRRGNMIMDQISHGL